MRTEKKSFQFFSDINLEEIRRHDAGCHGWESNLFDKLPSWLKTTEKSIPILHFPDWFER